MWRFVTPQLATGSTLSTKPPASTITQLQSMSRSFWWRRINTDSSGWFWYFEGENSCHHTFSEIETERHIIGLIGKGDKHNPGLHHITFNSDDNHMWSIDRSIRLDLEAIYKSKGKSGTTEGGNDKLNEFASFYEFNGLSACLRSIGTGKALSYPPLDWSCSCMESNW